MEILKRYLESINCNNSVELLHKFIKYYELLIEYNNKFNLTAVTDIDDVQTKHFIDSLCGLKYLNDNSTVIDIGSGAGFPSIPLALLKTNCRFTLVDSLLKRVNFLNTVITELDLKNCVAIHSRAEDLPKDKLYDIAIARAVAPLNTLLEYLSPFVKIKGRIVCYKGGNIDDELYNAESCLKELNCTVLNIDKYTLYNTDNQRSLIIFNKFGATKNIYPRPQNKPRIKPL